MHLLRLKYPHYLYTNFMINRISLVMLVYKTRSICEIKYEITGFNSDTHFG